MELVAPSVEYKESFMNAAQEFVTTDSSERGERYKKYTREIAENGFERFVEAENSHARGENLPEGYVPATILWLVDNGAFIGGVSIRHHLNEHLLKVGGHIGYDVRPSMRKQGYGSKMLELALPVAKRLGIERVLVTCDASNVGSRKIIEKNGGILENEVIDEEKRVHKLRYWIDV